jgi:CRISPR/Cas system-associated endoribonuclease Cas2
MSTKTPIADVFDSVFDINMMINMVRRSLEQMDCGLEQVDESVYVLRAADRLFTQLHDQLHQLSQQETVKLRVI